MTTGKHEFFQAIEHRLKLMKARRDQVSALAQEAIDNVQRAYGEPEDGIEYIKMASASLGVAAKVALDISQRAEEIQSLHGTIGAMSSLEGAPEFVLHQVTTLNEASTVAADSWATLGAATVEVSAYLRKFHELVKDRPMTDQQKTPPMGSPSLCALCGENRAAPMSTVCLRCQEDDDEPPRAA